MPSRREEFSAATRETIAGRAGYRCSFLSCTRVTIGPGASSGTTASIGVACHIFSAAPGGPRGWGGLSTEQITSADNGFWACESHAKLIDTNQGGRFSAGLLLGWRALHEARILREMGGIRLPVHWVESIEIVRSPSPGHRPTPLFKSGERLDLSRVTLLLGKNGSGKSALCDWLGGAAEENVLWRWQRTPHLSYELTVHNPERHTFAAQCDGADFVFHLDGARVPFNPLPVTVQVLGIPPPHRDQDSDLDWICEWLGLTPAVVRRLAETLKYQRAMFAEYVRISDDGEIEAKLNENVESQPYSLMQLSSSSRVFVAFALAAIRAGHAGLHAPTLLVLDGLSSLDAGNKRFVLTELGRSNRFQTLATLPETDPDLVWDGWSMATIVDGPEGALIKATCSSSVCTGPVEG